MYRIVYPCYDVDQDLICIVPYVHIMMSIRIQCVSYRISCYDVDQDLIC